MLLPWLHFRHLRQVSLLCCRCDLLVYRKADVSIFIFLQSTAQSPGVAQTGMAGCCAVSGSTAVWHLNHGKGPFLLAFKPKKLPC